MEIWRHFVFETDTAKKKKQRTNNQQKNIQKTQERESTKLFGNLIFLLITNNYHYYYLLHQFIYLSSVRIVEERHITHTHHTYNHPSFFFNTIAVSSLFFFFLGHSNFTKICRSICSLVNYTFLTYFDLYESDSSNKPQWLCYCTWQESWELIAAV